MAVAHKWQVWFEPCPNEAEAALGRRLPYNNVDDGCARHTQSVKRRRCFGSHHQGQHEIGFAERHAISRSIYPDAPLRAVGHLIPPPVQGNAARLLQSVAAVAIGPW